jgi:F-type H+-transporting ATPase subunit delta
MREFTVARRYAAALTDLVLAAKLPADKQRAEAQKAREQLSGFATLLVQNPPLRNVLASPAVPREKKLALLDALRGRLGLSPITRNFLAVLLDHRRLDLLEGVLEAFDRVVYSRLGIVPVEVTTAFSLDHKQKNQVEERWRALAGAQVELRYRENAAILGGAVARLGSTIYDASLRAQLRRLQQQLAAESR